MSIDASSTREPADTARAPDRPAPPGLSAAARLAGFSPRRRQAALLVLAAVLALDVVDGTIVNVAIPAIRHGLGLGDAAIEWVVAGYALAFALLLVPGGRLGDSHGYRRVFLLGVAGFTLASLGCGLARSAASLILARVVQGGFAALMAPQGMALIQLMYPPDRRTRVMGVFGTVGGMAAALGPVLGGALIQANLLGLTWRPVFLINAPIGLLAVAGGMALLPNGRAPRPARPDWPGLGVLLVGLLLLLVPLIEGRSLHWPLWGFASLALAPALLWGFVWLMRRQARQGRPVLISPALLARGSFRTGFAASLLFNAAIGGYLLDWSLLLQFGLGYSPLLTALTSIPFAGAVGFSIAVLSRRLVARFGRGLMVLGPAWLGTALLAAFGLTMLRAASPALPIILAPILALAGLGMGLFIGPIAAFTVAEVAIDDAGAASGLLSAGQQAGLAFGVALSPSLMFAVAKLLAGGAAHRLIGGFGASLGLQLGLLGLASAWAARLPRRIGAGQKSSRPG